MSKRLFLLIFFIFFGTSLFATPSSTIKKPSFIAISDLHFDPFIGCHNQKHCKTIKKLLNSDIKQWDKILNANKIQRNPRLRIGMDSNLALLDQVTDKLKNQVLHQPTQFIVITGDLLAHNLKENYFRYFKTERYYPNFVRHIFKFVQNKIQKSVGYLPVFFVMGNNDGYLGDYVVNADGKFFEDLAKDWYAFKDLKKLQPIENIKYLSRNGAYSYNNNNLRMIFLNTNLLHDKTTGRNKSEHAKLMMNWLKQQLNLAKYKNEKVLMFYHIPYGNHPGKKFLRQSNNSLWEEKNKEKFLPLFHTHKKRILGLIHGHVHREFFMKLHRDRQVDLPQYLVSAVSPIFGNKPSFTVFELPLLTASKQDIKPLKWSQVYF